jgi:rhodanese-related sulfurtransferase
LTHQHFNTIDQSSNHHFKLSTPTTPIMSSSTELNISNLPHISRESLASLLKAKYPSMAVIDVRDNDYIGGHIAGGTNVPSNTHDFKMPELVRTLADKETVVFHCALSQQRGPKAALQYLRERGRMIGKESEKKEEAESEVVEGKEGKEGVKVKGQTVYVLEGGFVKWQEV